MSEVTTPTTGQRTPQREILDLPLNRAGGGGMASFRSASVSDYLKAAWLGEFPAGVRVYSIPTSIHLAMMGLYQSFDI